MIDRSWKLLELLGEASGFFASRELENGRLQAELLLSAWDVRPFTEDSGFLVALLVPTAP